MSAGIYNRAPPSRATPTTLCQKCLQRGHYSYECKTKPTDRPYLSRPSRTKQLLNPKLKAPLTEQKMEDPLSKEGVADELLKRAAEERRNREGSAVSDDSVSTISTNAEGRSTSRSKSRSISPARGRGGGRRDSRLREDLASYDGRRSRARDRSPSSQSSSDSDRDHDRRKRVDNSRGMRRINQLLRSPSRSPDPGPDHGKFRSRDDETAGAQDLNKRRSASPRDYNKPRQHMPDPERRHPRREGDGYARRSNRDNGQGFTSRQRSPSPYSRRIALTSAMNS